MAGLSLSGLASGVDTSALVDQLMALERQSVTRLQYRQAALTGQQDALKEVASKLSALETAARNLTSDATWAQNQTAESTDPARVAVARTGGAGIGGHTVAVHRLASSMQRGFAFNGAAGGTITVGGTSFTVDAGATIQEVADAINARSTSPVVAAVIKNGANEDRLVLSSRTTGSSSDFTVTAPGVLTADAAYTTADPSLLNASYSLDGGAPQSSQTNVLEHAVPGLRITLKGVTAAAATVSVGTPEIDRAAIKTKVKAFVDAYNAVVDTTRAKLTEKPMANPTSDFQAARGQLFGDIGLQSMLSGLRTPPRGGARERGALARLVPGHDDAAVLPLHGAVRDLVGEHVQVRGAPARPPGRVQRQDPLRRRGDDGDRQRHAARAAHARAADAGDHAARRDGRHPPRTGRRQA
jgi:flagellar hook-associated protein 2